MPLIISKVEGMIHYLAMVVPMASFLPPPGEITFFEQTLFVNYRSAYADLKSGKGNGIKTVLPNITLVAQALERYDRTLFLTPITRDPAGLFLTHFRSQRT